MQKSVIEAEIMEYLWPRMVELRKAALVKHLIHGDRRSAKKLLDEMRPARRPASLGGE